MFYPERYKNENAPDLHLLWFQTRKELFYCARYHCSVAEVSFVEAAQSKAPFAANSETTAESTPPKDKKAADLATTNSPYSAVLRADSPNMVGASLTSMRHEQLIVAGNPLSFAKMT